MKRIAVVGVPGRWSSEALADAVEKLTGFRLLVDMGRAALDLTRGSLVCDGADLADMDAVVVKKIAPAYSPDVLDRLEMLRLIEAAGVRVFSRPSKCLRLVDRLACTVTLRQAGLPMPDTVVTEDVDAALEALEDYGRAVFKPLYSSKARGMEVIEAGPTARRRIEAFKAAGNPVMYMQRMLGVLSRDLGVVFMGGEHLATYARLGGGASWNTTILSGGRYAAHQPDAEILELADKAQALFGMDFTCVDVAETGQGPVLFEVSAFGGFRGLTEGCGLDAAARYAQYVLDSIS